MGCERAVAITAPTRLTGRINHVINDLCLMVSLIRMCVNTRCKESRQEGAANLEQIANLRSADSKKPTNVNSWASYVSW